MKILCYNGDMKKFLYILLWVLTVLNLAFCVFVFICAIGMCFETNVAGQVFGGIVLIFYYFVSVATTVVITGLSFITVKDRKLRVVIYVNVAAVVIVIATAITLFGFAFPQGGTTE